MTEQPDTDPVRVRIDLNARTHDGLYVPAHRHRASGPVQRGDTVTVFEPDDGVLTTATVIRCDDDWLHLDVDWDAMRDIPARELGVWRDPQLADRIRDAYAQAERGETVDLGSFEQYLDDDPMPPETAAGLARLRDAPDVFAAPTPERDGYTVGVYLPAGVTADVREYLFQAIGDLAHTADWHQGWDAHVVGVPGGALGAVDGHVRP